MRFIIFILFVGIFVKGQNISKNFVEAGGIISNLKVSSSKITSIQLVSGSKLGYFISIGKLYSLNERWSTILKLKIMESGGKVENSLFFIKSKLPKLLNRYKNAKLTFSLYQFSIEGNIVYSKDNIVFYTGVQPSVVFYGIYKEVGVSEEDNVPHVGNENTDIIYSSNKKIRSNIFSFKGQIGVIYNIKSKVFIDFGYHFNITNAITLLNDTWKIEANQDMFKLGVGYKF